MKTPLALAMLLCISLTRPFAADDDKPAVPDREAVAKFLTAYQLTPFADRGKHVVDAKEFEKVQESYYQGRSIPDSVETTVTSIKAGPKPDYLTVVARHRTVSDGAKNSATLSYYLVMTKNGLKADWAANAGYNPLGFKAWAAGTDKTFTLRVEAELSDYFGYHYGKAEGSHYSISFSDFYGDRADVFNGYIAKNSELGKRLFEIVKDGQKHKLIVTVERTGRETSVLGIKDLVSETWVK